jgi:CBS domain-containing protein/sporulation protein YlmC with PRC-barrel domain
MTPITTFYLSQLIGLKIYSPDKRIIGKIQDILVRTEPALMDDPARPRLVVLKTGNRKKPEYLNFEHFKITKVKGKPIAVCNKKKHTDLETVIDLLPLKQKILDQQIVDLNGRKVVRVNDIRFASVPGGMFVVAVDVGAEGLLRRLGVDSVVKSVASLFHIPVPSKFIMWDDVDTLDATTMNIKLGKPLSKLQTLHPSDLADIFEELGRSSRTSIFSSLNEEKAADVLEEMEPKMQVDMIESLPVAKAADVLEKMPADEAADIIDLLEESKAETLLKEMDLETSYEVRELLEYSDRSVGSIMSTDFLSFHENETVEQALFTIRDSKPEEPTLYNLFVVSHSGKLIATLSLRDLVLAQPEVPLKEIMRKDPMFVEDNDKMDSLAEIVSKYNLLAVPVVNHHQILEGMVVIDDIVDDLLGKRKTM